MRLRPEQLGKHLADRLLGTGSAIVISHPSLRSAFHSGVRIAKGMRARS